VGGEGQGQGGMRTGLLVVAVAPVFWQLTLVGDGCKNGAGRVKSGFGKSPGWQGGGHAHRFAGSSRLARRL
jgi:hypothetical protein